MQNQLLENIPASFYTIAGILIFANIGAIGSIIYAAFKTVWWFSKLDSRVKVLEISAEKESGAKEMAIRSHRRIDRFEKCLEN